MMTFLLPLMTWAALLSGDVGGKNLELDWQGSKTRLELAGKGLRAKKVTFISVKVYDAHLYLADGASFDRTEAGALNSLDTQKQLAMVLKFRREVDAKRVIDSFKEALAANSVKLDSPGIKEFLKAVEVGGPALEGKTLAIVGVRDGAGGETLIYENAKGEAATIKGSTGLIKQVMSIWLGKTSESTMEDLKASLLKKP